MSDHNKNETRINEWPSALKKTKARIMVINLLSESNTPRSALDIYDHLIKEGEKVNQSTIYRILESFVEYAMIKRIHYSEEATSYYQINDKNNLDMDTAVCLSCKKREYLEPTVLNQEEVTQQTTGFKVQSHRMEVYGYCGDCSEE